MFIQLVLTLLDLFIFQDTEVGTTIQNRSKMTATIGLVVHAAGKWIWTKSTMYVVKGNISIAIVCRFTCNFVCLSGGFVPSLLL
jgi:hypothetical protein